MEYEKAESEICKLLSVYVKLEKSEETGRFSWVFDEKKAKSDLTELYSEAVAVVLIHFFSDKNDTWDFAEIRIASENRTQKM